MRRDERTRFRDLVIEFPLWLWLLQTGATVTIQVFTHIPLILFLVSVVGAGVYTMDYGNIPPGCEYYVLGAFVIAIFLMLVYTVLIRFGERRLKVRKMTADALEKGEPLPLTDIERVEKFDKAYIVAAIANVAVAAVITAFVMASVGGYIVNTYLCAQFGETPSVTYALVTLVVTCIAFFIADTFSQKAADGSLKTRFLAPAQDAVFDSACKYVEQNGFLGGNEETDQATVKKALATVKALGFLGKRD